MNTIHDIDREMAEIDKSLEPLKKRRWQLEIERKKMLAAQFVSANRITMNDVELSSGQGKPFFQILPSFISWMKENNSTNSCLFRDRFAGRSNAGDASYDRRHPTVVTQRSQ